MIYHLLSNNGKHYTVKKTTSQYRDWSFICLNSLYSRGAFVRVGVGVSVGVLDGVGVGTVGVRVGVYVRVGVGL
ncbi:MAG TPA: hypothetical protein PLX14_07245 [Anaerolineales bacterium]|nr:hypothetical protein [Anaerolineales bacterium]HNC08482.1 hypothetical protein [Anaerolineales bacterium]